ncbi:MAG: CPBP family intramembrane glutamic endopeptidase [Anaerolineales bacterium]
MNTRIATRSAKVEPTAGMAWGVSLLLGALPILLQELTGSVPDAYTWIGSGALLLLLTLSFAIRTLKPLRLFFVLSIVLLVGMNLIDVVMATSLWQQGFGRGPWVRGMLGTQLWRLAIALVTLAVLFAAGLRRRDFFLVKGDLDAPVGAVKILGIEGAERWNTLGRNFALMISSGTLVFLLLGFRPSTAALARLLPLFPAVLLLAAMNAFFEELVYRAAMIGALRPAVGAPQALWITAVLFGLGHFYGVPYGVVGVLMSTFLGWFLGKSMLETGGFFWAWFIHLLQDILIFSVLAMVM